VIPRHQAIVGGGVLAVGLALMPTRASAQEARQEILVGKHKNYESPQHFALELRFSPFTPDIDSDPILAGATPYKDTFGSSPRLLLAGELDWQAARIRHVGTLGPGFGFGYARMSGDALFAPPRVGVSGETTSLNVFPFYAVAVLRVDALWREVGIPLVPYAKLGFEMALWRASNTLGTSSYDGVSGLGHSVGTQVAFGLALNLNVFDDYAARNFDEAVGVNNTYLFADWSRADLDGLWFQKDPLRVGGEYWTFGLAFEF
jgi:hypothetical protein